MSKPADENEKEALEKFREAVKPLLTPEQVKNDAFLLRWVRARDRNVDKALLMLKTSLEWRKQNNVDNILGEIIPYDFTSFFSCHFGGIDKCGRPALCVPVGEWDFRPLLDEGRKDGLVRFLVQVLEIFDMTLHEMWKNHFPTKHEWQHTQFSVVFDMKGFSFSKMMHKKSVDALLEVIRMYEANYPETLAHAVVINAPRIFATLFGMIRPLLSEHTASKIAIYDSKEEPWKKAVRAIIDEDQIPIRYGGILENPHPI